MDDLKFDSNRRRVKECPCGKSNRDGKFAPYRGYDTCGYCHSCGKTFLPDRTSRPIQYQERRAFIRQSPLISTVPDHPFESSIGGYERNHLITYLRHLFGDTAAKAIILRYKVGTSDKWPGATLLWHIDVKGRIRAGKIMLFNPDTGKRIRNSNSITWIKIEGYQFKPCLFGEHLLTDSGRTVAIVESEKTAMIMSEIMPDFIWLASGGSDGLTDSKCAVLAGRDVILFPDTGKYEEWVRRADSLKIITRTIRVSDVLESKAGGKHPNLDLADVMIGAPPPDAVPDHQAAPSMEHHRIVNAIFPFAGNELMSMTELTHALVWYSRRGLTPMERAVPTSEDDKARAEDLASKLIAAGAIKATPLPVYYHHFQADPYGYRAEGLTV